MSNVLDFMEFKKKKIVEDELSQFVNNIDSIPKWETHKLIKEIKSIYEDYVLFEEYTGGIFNRKIEGCK